MTKDIVLFKNGELELEVTISENREDVWLSQDQMATLFDVDRSRINRHYNDKELDETSTCAENAQVQFEGKRKGILEAIYQHVFGQELYPSMEEKAAHLLYFLIKDHPFVDGCKRIGVTIFLEFLNKNHHLFVNGKLIISNNTLVAIILMIAQSMPEEKETMVNLVMHFLST